MLALSRTTRAAHRLSLHARALSAVAHNASSSSSSSSSAAAATSLSNPAHDNTAASRLRPPRLRLGNSSAECMVVHTWDRIRSSAEGLAIARALQDKYGPAKEIIFPRDSDNVNLFLPYFWLVYDNPEVRKHLPEGSAQVSIQVAYLPRSNGNVGIEEMMQGLGLSSNSNTDAPHESPPTPAESETSEASKDAGDVSPDYKTLDVNLKWARFGPGEVLRRTRHFSASLPSEDVLPDFAAAWLAFDGFSPESARGPHTPNLLRARKKWQNIAPPPTPSSSARISDDDLVGVPLYQESVDAGTELEAEAEAELASASESQTQQNFPPREWVPIIPRGAQRSTRSPAPTPVPPKKAASASIALDHPLTADDAVDEDEDASTETVEAAPASSTPRSRMSRKERILHLARQNARTPLPELTEEPQPPTEAENERVDEESERRVKERTIRERLWRLVGGNY